jgi:PQ loop repeat
LAHSSRFSAPQKFGIWLLFPLLPLVLGRSWPETMTLTNGIKPLAQVASHVPQLLLCWRLKSTAGVSMMTQHLNIAGGLLGLFMCVVIPPVSATTYLIYINSMFQAVSLYALGLKFHGTIFQVQAGSTGGHLV